MSKQQVPLANNLLAVNSTFFLQSMKANRLLVTWLDTPVKLPALSPANTTDFSGQSQITISLLNITAQDSICNCVQRELKRRAAKLISEWSHQLTGEPRNYRST